MSEHAEQQRGPGLSRAVIAEMLLKNFEKLSDSDQKLFTYGPLYLGGNAGFAGLVANSLYRRVLNVQAARIASSLPMAVLPFLTTTALYSGVVSQPLLSGDLNCPTCSLIRGGLVGLVAAGVYPMLLALPLNLGLASRYSSAPMPEKGTMLRYCVEVSRPVFNKMRAVFLLQAVFGGYLGARHFQSYAKLAQITFSKGEELQE
ncbi:transmembrane protein 126A [Poeciliopsis prolifica]|uniref:transmembrane protein 126A n=1 Tax=Poeciliopsis prolifica TaxID=188132 RepID=UPI00072CCEF5|nr:transmembrane protein 126A [Poeciliopsis prolifica]